MVQFGTDGFTENIICMTNDRIQQIKLDKDKLTWHSV